MFNHSESSSWYNKPDYFEWVRNYDKEHIVFTDNSLHLVKNFTNKKKYAWLLESPVITPYSYDFIKKNHNKFDLIFTFDKELLEISEKFILLPIGGCWIEENKRCIFQKNKNLSMILSNKKHTDGHILRHKIYKNIDNIDYYGFVNPIENKIEALENYRFSVVVENTKTDFYFTEKLIDCFVTGTIPIYWGCPSVNNFFDENGILVFNTLNELNSILNNLDEDFYLSKLESIKHNFAESKKYLVADNFIYEKIKKNEKIFS